MRKAIDLLKETLTHDLKYLRPRVFLFLFNIIPDFYSLSCVRNFMLRLGGARIALFGAYIRSPFYASDLRGLKFGKGVFVNMGCRMQGTADIAIGDNCKIGPFCCLETVDHSAGNDRELPINIGSGVWLGARVVVTPGAKIGDCARVAAGAVVVCEVPGAELWGGVPARKLK